MARSAWLHPVHPVLVHFPIAFWLGASGADLIGWRTGNPLWWTLSHHAIVAGLVMGTLAFLAGGMELALRRLPAPAWRWVGAHAGLMSTALLCFLVSLSWRRATPPPDSAVWLGLFGSALLLVGGFCGGTLVYGYGVGVAWRAARDE